MIETKCDIPQEEIEKVKVAMKEWMLWSNSRIICDFNNTCLNMPHQKPICRSCVVKAMNAIKQYLNETILTQTKEATD